MYRNAIIQVLHLISAIIYINGKGILLAYIFSAKHAKCCAKVLGGTSNRHSEFDIPYSLFFFYVLRFYRKAR